MTCDQLWLSKQLLVGLWQHYISHIERFIEQVKEAIQNLRKNFEKEANDNA